MALQVQYPVQPRMLARFEYLAQSMCRRSVNATASWKLGTGPSKLVRETVAPFEACTVTQSASVQCSCSCSGDVAAVLGHGHRACSESQASQRQQPAVRAQMRYRPLQGLLIILLIPNCVWVRRDMLIATSGHTGQMVCACLTLVAALAGPVLLTMSAARLGL